MKTYYLKFGTGNPTSFTGLSPSFTIFNISQGATSVAAPGITESPAGSGLYSFVFGTTQSVVFVADGGAALAASDRYITGALDPIQAVDEKVGIVADSFGSTAADPSSIFGYLKRLLENFEGNAVFTKSTGIWQIFSRGSTTLLTQKTLTNTTTQATKS